MERTKADHARQEEMDERQEEQVNSHNDLRPDT